MLEFQYKKDAYRFLRDLKERFRSFGLELHPGKTRIINFGRFAEADHQRYNQGRPETFNFLGFTHYCTKTRKGKFRLGRKPISSRVNRTLSALETYLGRGCTGISGKQVNG